MAFSTAFQRSAFQVSAFQIAAFSPGGRIAGGQFSRGKWRELQERFAREDDDKRRLHLLKKLKEQEAARVAAEQRQAEVIARRQAEDALAKVLADHLAMLGAQQALQGAQIPGPDMALTAAAERARLLQEDEEETIALLLLS
mgnify:CR=1 FL=1